MSDQDYGRMEYHLRNLLARIHRDGGHYVEEHGLEKAVEDADLIVSDLLALHDLQGGDKRSGPLLGDVWGDELAKARE